MMYGSVRVLLVRKSLLMYCWLVLVNDVLLYVLYSLQYGDYVYTFMSVAMKY